MASRRVSMKGKGADLFFGGEVAPDVLAPAPPSDATQNAPESVLAPIAETDRAEDREQVVRNTPAPRASRQPARNRDTVVPRYPDTTIETIRRAVRAPGKEAATYRLTQEEKTRVGEIIYAYRRRGIRTAEIELSRIALNFILDDYDENGEESVLARVLRALHE